MSEISRHFWILAVHLMGEFIFNYVDTPDMKVRVSILTREQCFGAKGLGFLCSLGLVQVGRSTVLPGYSIVSYRLATLGSLNFCELQSSSRRSLTQVLNPRFHLRMVSNGL